MGCSGRTATTLWCLSADAERTLLRLSSCYSLLLLLLLLHLLYTLSSLYRAIYPDLLAFSSLPTSSIKPFGHLPLFQRKSSKKTSPISWWIIEIDRIHVHTCQTHLQSYSLLRTDSSPLLTLWPMLRHSIAEHMHWQSTAMDNALNARTTPPASAKCSKCHPEQDSFSITTPELRNKKGVAPHSHPSQTLPTFFPLNTHIHTHATYVAIQQIQDYCGKRRWK